MVSSHRVMLANLVEHGKPRQRRLGDPDRHGKEGGVNRNKLVTHLLLGVKVEGSARHVLQRVRCRRPADQRVLPPAKMFQQGGVLSCDIAQLLDNGMSAAASSTS